MAMADVVDIDSQDEEGCTKLFLAAEAGDLELC